MKKDSVTNLVSKTTRKELAKNGGKVIFNELGNSKKNKYSKTRNIYYYKGYDMLELLIVVRPYIRAKYNISFLLLDILLYLGGKKIFMQADFGELPKQLTFSSIKHMLKSGHVVILQDGGALTRHVFTLSTTTKNILKEFYGLLSGELKFPEGNDNPLVRSTATIDKKRMDLIKKINAAPAPEKHKPSYL
jgi:hypothetical protein